MEPPGACACSVDLNAVACGNVRAFPASVQHHPCDEKHLPPAPLMHPSLPLPTPLPSLRMQSLIPRVESELDAASGTRSCLLCFCLLARRSVPACRRRRPCLSSVVPALHAAAQVHRAGTRPQWRHWLCHVQRIHGRHPVIPGAEEPIQYVKKRGTVSSGGFVCCTHAHTITQAHNHSSSPPSSPVSPTPGSDNVPSNLQLDVNTLDIYGISLADNNGAHLWGRGVVGCAWVLLLAFLL